MTVKTHIFEINFKNDNVNGSTTILVYMNPINYEMIYVNTKTNKSYKSWEKMALEEYKIRGLITEKYKMYSNVIWMEKNE